MTASTALATGTVRWSIDAPPGVEVKVTFTPSVPLVHAAAPDPRTVVLAREQLTGESVTLNATDDPDVTPTGWTWVAHLRVGTELVTSFPFDLPAGAEVDLAELAPVPASSGVTVTQPTLSRAALAAALVSMVQDTGSDLRALLDSLYRGAGGAGVDWATVDLYGYGHSYVAGAGASDSAHYFLTVLDDLLGTAALSNRGIGGNSMTQTMHNIATGWGGSTAWAPGSSGLVVLDSVLNDVLHTTLANEAQDGVGFANALRTALRLLRAGSLVPPGDASITTAGPVTSFSEGIIPGGTSTVIETGGALSINGYEPTDVVLLGLAFSGLGDKPPVSVTVGGTEYGQVKFSDHAALTQQITGDKGGVGWGYQLDSWRITGLPAGAKTITLTPGTEHFYFGGYLTPPVAPPSVLVVQDAHLLAYTGSPYDTAAGSALLDARNATVASICAEAEFGGAGQTLVVDASVGYNPSTMLAADTWHRNDAGHAALAEAIRTAALALPARAGLT